YGRPAAQHAVDGPLVNSVDTGQDITQRCAKRRPVAAAYAHDLARIDRFTHSGICGQLREYLIERGVGRGKDQNPHALEEKFVGDVRQSRRLARSRRAPYECQIAVDTAL